MLVLQKGKSQISIVLTLSKIQIIDKCDFSKKHSTSKHFYTCWLFHYNYDNMNILLQLLPRSKGIHGHYNVFSNLQRTSSDNYQNRNTQLTRTELNHERFLKLCHFYVLILVKTMWIAQMFTSKSSMRLFQGFLFM